MGTLPTSERLEFRRWRRGDDALAATLWGDADVMRFLGGAYDAARIAARLEAEVANDERYGVQYWPIFIRATGDFAGCCGLKPHEPEHGLFEIGFHLRREFRGAGYAREAANAVIRFAFDKLRVAALFAGHHPDNEPSRRLLDSLGFVQIGTHFYPPTGLQHPWYSPDSDAPVSGYREACGYDRVCHADQGGSHSDQRGCHSDECVCHVREQACHVNGGVWHACD